MAQDPRARQADTKAADTKPETKAAATEPHPGTHETPGHPAPAHDAPGHTPTPGQPAPAHDAPGQTPTPGQPAQPHEGPPGGPQTPQPAQQQAQGATGAQAGPQGAQKPAQAAGAAQGAQPAGQKENTNPAAFPMQGQPPVAHGPGQFLAGAPAGMEDALRKRPWFAPGAVPPGGQPREAMPHSASAMAPSVANVHPGQQPGHPRELGQTNAPVRTAR